MELGGFIQALNAGLDIVAHCTDVDHLIALGMKPTMAEDMTHLNSVYFGHTSFAGYQRRCATTGHDVFTLLRIEDHVRRLDHRAAWALREKLCFTAAESIDEVAKAHTPTRNIAAGVRITRRRTGNHTLTITDTPLSIADMLGVLRATNDNLLDAARDVFNGNPGAAPVVHTNIIIPIDNLDRAIAGDKDVVLHLTNGATMTGADFVRRTLGSYGFITLVDPVTGPVNLYRTSRFATQKQRDMLAALFPTCCWPDCNTPVDECQIHHIQRWEDGGNTNLDNLIPLCKYHNAINDDDPAKPTGRGRMTRTGWRPPTATERAAAKATRTRTRTRRRRIRR